MPNIEYHSEYCQPSQPAVNVKDRTLYARDPHTASMIDELGEEMAQIIYEGVQEGFWNDLAPEIARQYGYGDVFSEGRSAGWLVVENPPDLDALENPDDNATSREERLAAAESRLAQWEAFAGEIDALVESCQREYPARLREALEDREAETRERAAMAARDIVTEQ